MAWSKGRKQAWRDGFLTMTQSGLAVFTWALVTGIAMAQSGLGTYEAIGMSLLVYAGSAQLAALPLMMGGFPLWTIWLTATIVNLRFLIFSAALQGHFKDRDFGKRSFLGYMNGDLTFAFFMSRYAMDTSDPHRATFFLGMATTNWMIWQTGSIIGILGGSLIPLAWGLNFAGTLALMAVLLPMLENRAMILSTGCALLAAILTIDLPYKLNLVVAVLAAIVVGTLCDLRQSASKAKEDLT